MDVRKVMSITVYCTQSRDVSKNRGNRGHCQKNQFCLNFVGLLF